MEDTKKIEVAAVFFCKLINKNKIENVNKLTCRSKRT